MTIWLSGIDIAGFVRTRLPEAVVDANEVWFEVAPAHVLSTARLLRDEPSLSFEMATNVTAVDWEEWFEVVYHLQSLTHNHIATLKMRVYDREQPEVPSLVPVWYGAHLQETEVYDLFGIRFSGHPNLRRIFLWDGFSGWPLRKDFLQVGRGAFHPGLPHFPKEGGDRGVLDGPSWSEQEAGWRPRPTPGIRPPAERRAGGHQQMGSVTPDSGE